MRLEDWPGPQLHLSPSTSLIFSGPCVSGSKSMGNPHPDRPPCSRYPNPATRGIRPRRRPGIWGGAAGLIPLDRKRSRPTGPQAPGVPASTQINDGAWPKLGILALGAYGHPLDRIAGDCRPRPTPERFALHIVKFNEIGADLIVMGSNAYGKVQRFLLGGVSEDVVRNAKCSVMIAK
jgi:hypothetical protein